MSDNKQEKFTSLSEKEFLILGLLINNSEMFGLEMVKVSEGLLKRGTVYITLQRMEEKGYIVSRTEPRTGNEIGIPRRVYKVVGLGERAYRTQVAATEMFGSLKPSFGF